MNAEMCLECFHTAGATGPNPVPPTIQNKILQRFPHCDSLAFGTANVAGQPKRSVHIHAGTLRN